MSHKPIVSIHEVELSPRPEAWRPNADQVDYWLGE
jgi:hypothetical protein